MMDSEQDRPRARGFFRERADVISFTLFSLLSASAVVALCVTFGAWLLEESAPDPQFMLAALSIDAGLMFALLCVLIRRWRKKNAKKTIAERSLTSPVGLKARIALTFSLVAAVPAAAMAVFSLLLFDAGVRAWFDTKVSGAISNSVAVAEAYLKEHKHVIAGDILGIGNDLNRHAYMIRRNPAVLDQQLTVLASVRKVPEALIFMRGDDGYETIIARSYLTIALEFFLDNLTDDVFERADNGEAVVFTQENEDRVTALLRLESLNGAYLYVGRPIDRDILNHVNRTRGAAREYERMEQDISRLHMQFFSIFLFIAGGLLIAVIFYGVYFAANIVRPLNELSAGAAAISKGEYGIRVAPGGSYQEIRELTATFNRMSGTLKEQRTELISVQRHQAWSDIARRIAHEIKNPLTPIQLSAERLKKRFIKGIPPEDAGAERYIDTVLRNVTQIRNIIEEFTVFAKIKPPVLTVQDCLPIVRHVVTSQEIASAAVRLSVHTHGAEQFMIHCDESKFAQIMLNILKNACEALEDDTDRGPSEGQVEIHVFETDGACGIIIADNGPGFPEHLLPSLTEPYVTTKKKGTGLGLAIVKKLVEDHGGDISFSNRKNGGAETTLVFPLAKPVKIH